MHVLRIAVLTLLTVIPGGRAVDRRPHCAEARERHAGDFPRRPPRGLRGARDQLGRQRLRDRDSGSPRPARPAAPVRSPTPPSRAASRRGRPTARGWRSSRTAASTRQLYRLSLEGGEAEALTSGDRGRHGVRLVARRHAHRLHDDRPGHGGDEGARREVRRVHARGSTTTAWRSCTWSTWPPRRRGRSPPARSSSAPSTGRPTARGSRSTTALNSDAGSSGSADISLVEVASGRGDAARHARPGQTAARSGPPMAARSCSSRRWPSRSTSSRTARWRWWPRRRRHARGHHRPFRREPVARRLDAGRASSSRRRSARGRTSIASIRRAGRSRCTASARTGSASRSRSRPTATHTAFVASGPREFPEVYVGARGRHAGADPAQRPRRAGGGLAGARSRGRALEEPGRRRDRGRAAQAGGLPGRDAAIRCSS